ncbi:MAG TPA: isoprenylcysteine carboxylmethyltransferase family protein [Polyangia bacterium]|nr:isoprenylcysteine carboxylmethyltransferase family protein [Polyangia bacterium]
MTTDQTFFVGLLVAVGAARLIEMRLSRRHQRVLAAHGFARAPEPGFRWMVALHTGILVAAAVEVLLARRPLIVPLAVTALVLFVLANGLRVWVIRTMAGHWNVNVVNSMGMGVVSHGPYRFVRHPNYVAVFVELLALPLVHTAYVTALVGAILHVLVLRRRLALEDGMLLGDPAYRAAMADKPRFVPRFVPRFSHRAPS